jgi:arylsulfatase A-like enzyme
MAKRKRKRPASRGSVPRRPRRGLRRPPLRLLLVAAAVTAAGGAGWLLRRALAPVSPTVVVVLIDTLRQDALGGYGCPDGTTPHLDALAAESATFRDAVSTSCWTLPAVGSLLTGTWPTLHGGFGKGVVLTPIRDEVPTLAEVLRDAGFRTTGVANAAFVSPMLNLDRGFDVFDHRYAYNSSIRRADESVDAAIARLRAQRRRPHFLFLHLFDPHLNYDPPPPWDRRFTQGLSGPPAPLDATTCRSLGPDGAAWTRGVYLGEVAFVDRQVGRLAAELRRLGLWDACTFVVLSDHGEELWDHGGFEHGHSLRDELIAIPLLVKPPAAAPTARPIVGAQVRMVDVPATLLDLAGVDAPGSFTGESLAPLLAGRTSERLVAFAEGTLYGDDRVAWRTRENKLIVDLNAAPGEALELTDRTRDPAERRNLTAEEPETAARLQDELGAFLGGMVERAERMSQPAPRSLAPADVERLRSLGYLR